VRPCLRPKRQANHPGVLTHMLEANQRAASMYRELLYVAEVHAEAVDLSAEERRADLTDPLDVPNVEFQTQQFKEALAELEEDARALRRLIKVSRWDWGRDRWVDDES